MARLRLSIRILKQLINVRICHANPAKYNKAKLSRYSNLNVDTTPQHLDHVTCNRSKGLKRSILHHWRCVLDDKAEHTIASPEWPRHIGLEIASELRWSPLAILVVVTFTEFAVSEDMDANNS